MKTKMVSWLAAIVSTGFMAALPSAIAGEGGGVQGGGGDAGTEMRIDEIRADISKWISEGGGYELKLPADISVEVYRAAMSRNLERHAVIIGAVTSAEESMTSDSELKVIVGGQPKTCRGFISSKDQRPHILCNVERFKATAESKQYSLIHHEYAGLALVEQNVGASSDYSISNQITDYLVSETVLRLAVKKVKESEDDAGYGRQDASGNFDIEGSTAQVKQSSDAASVNESKLTMRFYDEENIEYLHEGGGIEGSIGTAGGKITGGGKLEGFMYEPGKKGTYGVAGRLVSDTGVRYSEVAKLQVGGRIKDSHGYVEINGSVGGLYDRSNGLVSMQSTAGVQTQHKFGKRLTINTEAEAGLLSFSESTAKTRTSVFEQGQVTYDNTPTSTTRELVGQRLEVTELVTPEMRSTRVGTVVRGKAAAKLRINKNWSVRAEAGATRTKTNVENVYLDGSTGNAREIKNNEYRAGAAVTATF